MATSQDAIARLSIQSTESGIDETAASLNKLAEAYGGVTVASSETERVTASSDKTFASIEAKFISGIKAQNDYAKVQAQVNAAVSQNPALQDRANVVLAAAAARMAAVSNAAGHAEKDVGKISEVMAVVESRAAGMSASMGMVGAVLQVIGPAGLAVGAALGVAAVAMKVLFDQANEAGAWAQSLQRASDTIGLNTTEMQGLNEAAAQVGVSANDNVGAFERFTVSLGALKNGSGTLRTELLKVNPALVNQLSVAKDAATGWNLLAQAYSAADKQQQALISRAAFGRGGAAEGAVLQATADAGGIGGLPNENAVSTAQIAQWSKLTTQINSATEAAQHNFQSIFTPDILTGEKNFAQGMLTISQAARDFAMSEDFKKYFEFLSNPIVAGAIGGAVVGAVGGSFFGGVGAIPGAIAGGVAGGVAGATVKGVSSVGAAATSRLPPAPNFDATFSATSAQAAKTASDLASSSLGNQAAAAKDLVAALGGAATAQEKLDATTKQLAVELANGKITQDTYNKALAGAQLDTAISVQSARTVCIGTARTAADLLARKPPSRQDNDKKDDHYVGDECRLPAAA